MNKMKGLHTIARRYCIDRIKDLEEDGENWKSKFSIIYEKTKDYECDELNKLYDEYPDINIRKDILNVILQEVERIVPEKLNSVDELRKEIILACENAKIRHYIYYYRRDTQAKDRVSDDEKQKFNFYINSLKEEDLNKVKSLFYRRVLSKQECERGLQNIEETWDVFDDSKEEIIAFWNNNFFSFFRNELNIELLRKILYKHGVKKVIEIEECGRYTTAREIEVSALKFNSFIQGYWFSEKMDWVIYSWHEDRVFVCGKWLLDEIKEIWHDWDKCINKNVNQLDQRIKVVKGDITKTDVEAIVNAANNSLLGGGGVDGAIHRAGGREILDECIKIRNKQGGCKTGQAVITSAGKLEAKYVIHTVGPVWNGGNSDEENLLESSYINSLKLAVENNVKTIAFSNISTGVYGFPKELAAEIAIQAVSKFLAENDTLQEVIFVCFDDENFNIYSQMIF